MRYIAPILVVATSAFLLVPGCGGSDSGGTAAPAPSGGAGAAGSGIGGSGVGGSGAAGSAGQGGGAGGQGGGAGGAQAVSQAIVAADGGTVSAEGISIVIPPGALAVNTTVTITLLDKSAQPTPSLVTSKKVFDVGPNGTTFSKPVAMTLDYDASSVPAGNAPTIAYIDKGGWVPLKDSSVSNGKVSATTTHFTTFGALGGGAGGAAGAAGAGGAGGAAAGGAATCGSLGAACNDVVQGGTDVPAAAVAGSTPTGSGGAVVDGHYFLTEFKAYTGSPVIGVTLKQTLDICSGTLQLVEDEPSKPQYRESFTFSPSGTALNLTKTCTTESPPVDIPYASYTATATALTVYSTQYKFSVTYTKP